jgi:putative ABC transport system permease protein
MTMRVPLAWQNLTHNKRRLALAISGVGFAVVLMFMQIGFRNGMLDSNVAFLEALNADLIVTSPARYSLAVSEPFPRQRLVQTLGCPGVSAAYPLYVEQIQASLVNRADGIARPIRVVAFDPNHPLFLLPEVEAQRTGLRLPQTALVDAMNRPDFGEMQIGSEVDLSGRPVRLIGSFRLGTDFANDGTLITSPETLATIFPQRPPSVNPLDSVDLGLVRIAPNASAAEVRDELVRRLPDDIRVFLKQDYIDQELNFWNSNTPVGFIFGLGSALGFAVGVIICYQILYTDIADHVAEFATLKAMGYPFRYFVGVVLAEAVWLAVLGFVPGVAISAVAYKGLGAATGLMMNLSVPRVLLILVLTIAMCVVSAGLAIRRLIGTDPAELFA